jgi:YD repeat-containing protein
MNRGRRITLSLSIAVLLLLLPIPLWAAANDPSISYQYDAMGNLIQRADGLGHVTTQRFDALNRLISQLQPALNGTDTPGEVQYQYDAQGNTAQITDPKGFTTDNTIDGLGNLIQLDSPDTGTSTYIHDQAGNLVSRIDAAGVAARYRYDVVNRLIQVQHAKSGATTESVTVQYDQGTNGLGRLSKMRNNSGQITTWNYDRQGRITGQQQTTGQLNLKLQVQYDNAGRPQTLTYPSGRVVAYHYDATDRISQIDVDGVPAITGIIWQPFGSVQSWTWVGSGNSYVRSYDLAGRVTSVTLGDKTRSLEWDAGNRIV